MDFRWRIAVLCLTAGLGLSGCGGRHLHATTAAETRATPRFLELRSEMSANTLHFPRGTYVLDSADAKGFYYRSPRKISQRSFSGGLGRDGGIFVAKRDRRKLRGYVIMPGGLTHIGNFSGADYEFRD